MNKKQIKAEKDRLRPILFEGAPDCAVEAMYSRIDLHWCWQSEISRRSPFGKTLIRCKNQPETTLDWKDTLIRRDGGGV